MSIAFGLSTLPEPRPEHWDKAAEWTLRSLRLRGGRKYYLNGDAISEGLLHTHYFHFLWLVRWNEVALQENAARRSTGAR